MESLELGDNNSSEPTTSDVVNDSDWLMLSVEEQQARLEELYPPGSAWCGRAVLGYLKPKDDEAKGA